MEQFKEWFSNPEQILDLALKYGGQLVLAILTLLIGLWVIGKIVKGMKKMFEAKGFDASLQSFLISLTGIVLKIMLVISVVSMLGVEMTSFVAILAAAGLAIGMALSGTLQNFAGGVMILIFRPFKVGDYITSEGHSGTVKEIQIFHTILNTPDKKTIILPNGPVSNGSTVNYSTEPVRRVDFTFGIGYNDDIDKAKQVIMGIIEKDERILKDPAPFVGVINLGESSVDLVTRVWANAGDYWDIFFEMQETVKKEFDRQGVSIPFPQRDVHLFQAK
ncbi:mechanosensitive ion channel family protein [Marinilabilia salmonicolor]|uniref:Small conductance mechanosensitive channel n=1 Tax=Marinilabilia salmonicolor TaxID=989 RepID=A0A2T0XQ65_9BACT|nr:mechanosensitive ion channel domain-containing protein [Marinilabilia salmonicolor]PRZ01063.1 small conductance mechanosensitive channel [Marinilabilia salmonicolor]RCW33933.1 small conductance mechanosensitive channel [Marinilabilia salmonicolor]